MGKRSPARATTALLLLIASVLLLSGCTASPIAAAPVAERQVRAVATTGMVADVVANVGGERITVRALMGPGVDPHLYKASEGDVLRLSEADVIFYSGLHLEAKMADVLEKIGKRIPAFAVTDGIPRDRLVAPPQFQGQYDPHVWFDVSMWRMTVPVVRDALIRIDPDSTALYTANAAAYEAKLDALHEYAKNRIASIPAGKRVMITAHDAFNYFGRAYGLEVRGLQGISTATEAGTGDVSALAAFIAERRVPAIFIESSVPERNINAVRAAVQSRGFDVRVGGELFSDAMGDAGKVEGTYVGMVRHNVDIITTALSVP